MAFSFLKRNDDLNLSPADFLDRVGDAAVVLDVRTPSEFAQGHLAGAENVDLMAPDFRDRVNALDRERTYYLYCRSGNRSGQAAKTMQAMGFPVVYNIGGFDALTKAGAETMGTGSPQP